MKSLPHTSFRLCTRYIYAKFPEHRSISAHETAENRRTVELKQWPHYARPIRPNDYSSFRILTQGNYPWMETRLMLLFKISVQRILHLRNGYPCQGGTELGSVFLFSDIHLQTEIRFFLIEYSEPFKKPLLTINALLIFRFKKRLSFTRFQPQLWPNFLKILYLLCTPFTKNTTV